MARRYEVTDEQWEVLQTYFGNSPKQTGRPQSDNRKLLNGVLWILHTGAPWRDLPEYYGPWQTVYKRFAQWQKNDKFKQLFDYEHYRERHLVEAFFMKIKNCRRIAMRFEKPTCRFLAFLHLNAALLWLA